ncbi:MAG: hypothetical protein IT307_03125 [Chloroflexi bacterium]|nr:hypothetical protein [Chloroflexota bacterium]
MGATRPVSPCTLFLCIPSGTPSANLLRTSVFQTVRDDPSVGRIVILSPYSSDVAFREEFGDAKVGFADLDPGVPGWLERRFIRIMQERFVKRMPTESMRIRVARADLLERAGTREVRYLDRGQLTGHSRGVRRASLKALTYLALSIGAWFRVADRFTLGDRYADLFERERPSLLVTPTTGLYFSEGPLMARADRLGVPTIAVDLSWDHFTTKTAPLRRVAALSVWNRTMQRQAVEIHGYRRDQVRVSGVPQFDLYRTLEGVEDRAAFFKRVGADPSRKLITLTTVPPVLYRHHDLAIERLLTAIDGGQLGEPAQILVRVHPRDDLKAYERFVGRPNLVVEKPFRTGRVAEGSSVDPSRDDRWHLANTLVHSDVVVNVASTIAIEAAICDTPVVNIGFDGTEPRPFLDSAARYYVYDHYRPLVEAGAVRVADSAEAMVRLVRDELLDPARGRAFRAQAVEEQCRGADGKASERVAAFIVDAVQNLARQA